MSDPSHVQQPHWRRWVVIGVVAAIVAVGVVVASLFSQTEVPASRPTPTPSASVSASPTATTPVFRAQRVLLLEVRDDDRHVVFAQIMATGFGKTPGKLIPLTPDLLVPTPTWSQLRFTGDANDTLQSQHALEELLGINIDISLTLDRLAFAGLIDSTLTPSQAARARESADISSVVNSIIANLPATPEAAGQVVLSLGHMARSSASNSELVDLMLTLRKDAISQTQKKVTLPTSAVRASGAVVVDRSATDVLMKRQFPVSLLNPGEAVRPRVVLIPAGASAAQLALATENLIDAGMTVIPGETSTRVVASRIRVPQSPVSLRIGQRAASAVGLFPQEVKQAKGVPVDVEIALGPDVPAL
ncbi:MAG: hypothetical protein Q8M73_12885 [Actinomycetota bacterium]|nr:hypothetical protein [Actinomycetota bacterium]